MISSWPLGPPSHVYAQSLSDPGHAVTVLTENVTQAVSGPLGTRTVALYVWTKDRRAAEEILESVAWRTTTLFGMDAPAYVSRVRIERLGGPQRLAYLPAEAEPVTFGVHAEVAEHYGVSPADFPPHATTLDYVVAAAGG